jgi:hypothetical protein
VLPLPLAGEPVGTLVPERLDRLPEQLGEQARTNDLQRVHLHLHLGAGLGDESLPPRVLGRDRVGRDVVLPDLIERQSDARRLRRPADARLGREVVADEPARAVEVDGVEEVRGSSVLLDAASYLRADRLGGEPAQGDDGNPARLGEGPLHPRHESALLDRDPVLYGLPGGEGAKPDALLDQRDDLVRVLGPPAGRDPPSGVV